MRLLIHAHVWDQMELVDARKLVASAQSKSCKNVLSVIGMCSSPASESTQTRAVMAFDQRRTPSPCASSRHCGHEASANTRAQPRNLDRRVLVSPQPSSVPLRI